MIKLSDRLQIIAYRTKPSQTMADIGTDHGFLPIYLKEHRICEKVIMADISEPSLEKARRNAANCSSEVRSGMEFRVGDGLKVLEKGEADTVVIAGMGGKLIRDILAEDMDLTYSVNKFVMQPRIGQGHLRKWLCYNGFAITNEDLVIEGDYIPEIITASVLDRKRTGFGHDLSEGYAGMMMQYDDDRMIWRIPPWILEACGPVEEFLIRNIEREKTKLKNVMMSKKRNLQLEMQIHEDIQYLENLLEKKKDI